MMNKENELCHRVWDCISNTRQRKHRVGALTEKAVPRMIGNTDLIPAIGVVQDYSAA